MKRPKQNRTITIIGRISEDVAGQVFSAIEELDSTKGDIRVKILSGGGEVAAGLAIYDRLRQCKNRVITEGCGEVVSIAMAIYLAGDIRQVNPHCRFMVHNVAATIEGQYNRHEMQSLQGELTRLDKLYFKIMADRTGVEFDRVAAWCDKTETYFTAEQAVNLNIAHEILLPSN